MLLLFFAALPEWFNEVFHFSLNLSNEQKLGLAFLLGSFSVATWSDLKRLSAQREFLEIWLLFLLVMLGIDFFQAQYRFLVSWPVLAIKWGLIALFSILALTGIGRVFKLARADVAAMAAAASLLSPLLIVLFYIIAKLLAVLIEKFLRSGTRQWAFMPVVSLSTLAVLALGLLF
jgi:hypothetical protein